ncbi:immunity protein YezG family protein [Micromonospora sp. RB23]
MLTSRDAEFTNRIGGALLSALPDRARSITARCKADADYASVQLTFINDDGSAGHFTFDDEPVDASSEVNEAVMDWWDATKNEGKAPWYGVTMTVERDGNFDVNFSYDPPQD